MKQTSDAAGFLGGLFIYFPFLYSNRCLLQHHICNCSTSHLVASVLQTDLVGSAPDGVANEQNRT